MSFYKIKNTFIISQDKKQIVSEHTNNTRVLSTNIQIFYMMFLLHKMYNQSLVDFNKHSITFFFLPKRKTNVIFLRAPYKNKLARLNILNVYYKFFINISNKTKTYTNVSNKVRDLQLFINTINFSSPKIKHTKTKISLSCSISENLLLKNFN